MKLLKLSVLLFLTAFALLFNACEETTTTGTDPVIDDINPKTGLPGEMVTITGSNFGEYNQSTCKVMFVDVPATIYADGSELQWSNDEIIAIIPQNAKTGNITVVVDGKTSNGYLFTIKTVKAPTDLMATSKSATSVLLKWTASTDEGESDFQNYVMTVTPAGGTAVEHEINKGVSTFTASSLTEGVVYKFELQAVRLMDAKLYRSSAVTVNWSPASRFDKNAAGSDPVQMFESASSFGSGLMLYDGGVQNPNTFKVANGANWDLGLFTNDGAIDFGSAKNILAKYSSFSGTARKCEISSTSYNVNSLDEVFDTQALDISHSFSERLIDLKTLTSSVVFVVRTNSPEWNYAKVLVVYKNSSFLQGTTGNKYLELQVSYQRTAGVPYAL